MADNQSEIHQEKEILTEDPEKKAQELLEEKEADSRMRNYSGPMGKCIVLLLCVWTAFQLYFTTAVSYTHLTLPTILRV